MTILSIGNERFKCSCRMLTVLVQFAFGQPSLLNLENRLSSQTWMGFINLLIHIISWFFRRARWGTVVTCRGKARSLFTMKIMEFDKHSATCLVSSYWKLTEWTYSASALVDILAGKDSLGIAQISKVSIFVIFINCCRCFTNIKRCFALNIVLLLKISFNVKFNCF